MDTLFAKELCEYEYRSLAMKYPQVVFDFTYLYDLYLSSPFYITVALTDVGPVAQSV